MMAAELRLIELPIARFYRNVVTLTGVAMLNGTLYCKVCFKRLFKETGRYDVFDTHAATRARAASEMPPSTAIAPTPVVASATDSHRPHHHCAVADCTATKGTY